MGSSSKDPLEKHEPSAKALGELMDLFLKLNSKLREKISPRPKEEKGKTEKTEMIIIILNSSSENTPGPPARKNPSFPSPTGSMNSAKISKGKTARKSLLSKDHLWSLVSSAFHWKGKLFILLFPGKIP